MLDLCTAIASFIALGLYVARAIITKDMKKTFDETRGNEYIR